MDMKGFAEVAKYLSNPLVLVGFALFIFSLLMTFRNTKLVREMKWLMYSICVIVIVGGLVIEWRSKEKPNVPAPPPQTQVSPATKDINVETEGDQSPGIVTKGDVNVNYGSSSKSAKEQANEQNKK